MTISAYLGKFRDFMTASPRLTHIYVCFEDGYQNPQISWNGFFAFFCGFKWFFSRMVIKIRGRRKTRQNRKSVRIESK